MTIHVTQHERRRYRYRPKLKAAGDWRLGERLPVVLALLSSLALLVSKRAAEWSRSQIAIVWLIEVSVVAVAHVWIARSLVRRERWLKLAFPVVAVGMLGPLFADPLMRSALSRGQTPDGLLLDGLSFAVLGLAIFAFHSAVRRLCCAGALFLTVFSCCLSSDPFVLGLVVVFAVLGVWWLMGSYWEGLRRKLAAGSQEPLPRRWLFGLPAIVVVVLLLIPWNGRESLLTLWGVMPSSGGTGDFDEFARSGVNDGDLLVGAKDNARSFGAVESDVFMDSDKPSLYDVFYDMYGEPIKKKKQERAVALPAELMREAEQRMAQSRTVGREFSTVRQPKAAKDKPKVKDIDGRAVFHVQGRVPLHLRLELYDLFDGRDWLPMPEEKHPAPLQLRTIGDKPWIELHQTAAVLDLFAAEESHALKIHRLDTNHLPLPVGTTRLHIDRIDRPDFFAVTQPSILRMTRDKLPPQLVLHIASRPQDESQFLQHFKMPSPSGDSHMLAVPVATREPGVATIHTLAHRWTTNIAPRERHLPVFLCPSDPISGIGFVSMGAPPIELYAMGCYVANFGPPDLDANQEQRDGVFSRNSSTRLGDIKDGLSQTLFVGERVNGPFRAGIPHGVHITYETTWAGAVRDSADPTDDHGHMVLFQSGHPPNDAFSDDRDVSSAHENVSHFLMGDGRVVGLSQNMNLTTYQALTWIAHRW